MNVPERSTNGGSPSHARGYALSQQLRRRGIHDERVLAAVADTPRERFVPEELLHEAYDDNALPIGDGQTISQPYIVALMTQELKLTGRERVLEIGTGSGYQAAILARLCAEVVTVERLPHLAEHARMLLNDLGHDNIDYHVGDGTLGVLDRAPYDGILVTAAAPEIPPPLYEQLRPGGRLVLPVGDLQSQMLELVEKTASEPQITHLCGCRFVSLIGEAAWPDGE